MFSIHYYADASGRKPVEEFIDSLEVKMRAKIFGRLELHKEYGPLLTMPFSRHLEEGIFELRCVQAKNITRILYFFMSGEQIILTHGFVKKTQKTPRREIERAKQLRDDWRNRRG